ncbi:hypothetical protein BF28_5687 (plasmid) [Bacillus cereus E33L]|nr:hypothetical protein BF28_5687 [Bacillus cereus E33L]
MVIFQWLESWLSIDIFHFNLFVGITTFLTLASVILFSITFKKIGTNDSERLRIKLQISYTISTSLLVLLAIFILWMPTNTIYFRQYLIMIIPSHFFSDQYQACTIIEKKHSQRVKLFFRTRCS